VSAFGVLRAQIDIASVAACYTDFYPSGDALKGHCPHPDHEDKDPSFYVYPEEARFYCYGCRWHGDVTDLWAGVKGLNPGIEAAQDLAREYGIDLPKTDPEALQEAQRCRMLEDKYLEQAKEHHADLLSHPEVVAWWKKRGFDEELCERFLLGGAGVGKEATIPFWSRGRVQGIIRRKLSGEPKYLLPRKDEFSAAHRPLFIPGAVKGETFLVEGYVDALALVAFGFSAVAVGGTGISEPQMEELKQLPGPLYVLPDNDEEGEKAARGWVQDLYPKALLCPPNYEKEKKNE